MGAFYRLMAVFIDAPWLAAVPGAALLAVWAGTGRRLVLAAAAAWLLCLPYEYGMKWRRLVRRGMQHPPRPAAPVPGARGAVERRRDLGRARLRAGARLTGRQSFAVTPSRAKKSFPLSSTTTKAGKSSTSMRQTASMPSSGYSSTSTLRMQSCASRAAGPPMEPR